MPVVQGQDLVVQRYIKDIRQKGIGIRDDIT